MSLRCFFKLIAFTIGPVLFVAISPSSAIAADGETAAPTAPPPAAAPVRSNRMIEEVIVTARKREERAVDTPVALAALSQAEIERYNTRDLAELTARLPGLQITHAAGGGAGGNISIRGVGNLAVDYGADQPVSLVLDGMSFTRGHVLDVGFFDVAGVEVLKGPQALYFGKNSPAGVVAVTSRSPKVGANPEYFGRASYGFVTDDPVFEAGVSVPIGDTLATRLALRYEDMRGGYLKNTARPIAAANNPLYAPAQATRGKSYDKFPEQRQRVMRLTTVWQPTEAFQANLKDFYSYTRQNDAGNTILYSCADGVGGHPYYIFVPDLTQTCTHHPKLERNGALPPAAVVNTHPHLSQGEHLFNQVTNNIHTLELDYSVDNLKFTSVTGYWTYRHREYTNYDYTSYAVVISKQGETGRSFTEEFRVQSSFNFPVNFMAGVFYEKTRRDLDAPVQILPEVILRGVVPNPTPGRFFGTYINYYQHWENEIKSQSAFGSLDWTITDKLTLSGGARYTKEDRASDGGNIYERGLGFSPAGVIYHPDDSSTNLSPELTLSYRPIDDLMFYVAAKSGFQSAGISNPGTVPNLTSLSLKQQTDALVFGESKVRGVETGVKGYFFDQRLTGDVVLYRYKYKDLQVGIFNPVTTTFTIQNAAAATNTGIDVNAQYQLLDNWQVRLSGQYNRLKFDEYKNAGCNAIDDAKPIATLSPTGPGCHVAANGKKEQDLSGERYGGPPLQVNLGTTVGFSLLPNWRLSLTGDVIYYDKGQESLRQKGTAIHSRTLVNLAANITQDEGPWNVSLVCSNCANEIYVTGIGNKPLAKTGDLTGFVGEPRLVTLQLTYDVR